MLPPPPEIDLDVVNPLVVALRPKVEPDVVEEEAPGFSSCSDCMIISGAKPRADKLEEEKSVLMLWEGEEEEEEEKAVLIL